MEIVTIVEVGPRDGLQNEKITLPVDVKIEFIRKLTAAGLKKIEVTSFVHPKWIPQLADADQLLQSLTFTEETVYSALVPNRQGLERALKTSLPELAVFMSASETHNLKNINKTMDQTLPVLEEVVNEARAERKRIRGYVSTVFGCPYEGEVNERNVMKVCESLIEMGVDEISLGDTIGVATPKQVKERLAFLFQSFDKNKFAVHFHDTRGTGIANVYTALEMGIRTIDSSCGGLGGCPYAPGAAGNVATEDVIYLLNGLGVKTGVDLDLLCEAGVYIQNALGRTLPSKVLQAYYSTSNERGN